MTEYPLVDAEDADARKRTGANRLTNRNLRLEIRDLQQRLKTAEDVATQHAVMLREGDHRIKNSLQLVASLMRVQAAREASTTARRALRSAAERVSSIASIHDALQGTGGLDLVDLGPVLEKMCVSLQDMAGDEGHIAVSVDVECVEIPVALAQPLVLAVNELVVNALRHAFPGRDRGEVNIALTRTDDSVTVCVSDDGVGLPANHADGKGYGMSLVNMMVKQVRGELRTECNAGTKYTIRTPFHTTVAVDA